MSSSAENPVMEKPFTPRALVARVVLVLLVCVGTFWVRLGSSSFAMSEAQRALPAWEMLDRHDMLVPHLFGQAYMRKPPGVQWLIALSSEALGRTEFAAPAPSALAMTLGALVAMWFAARWFGARWCVYAGLAHSLTPLFWYPGRSAEIEAPHNFFVQLLVLAGIDLMVNRARPRALMAALVALGVAGAALSKGPGGAPCIAGVAVGCALALRSWRGAGAWWGAVVLGVIPAAWIMALSAARAAGMSPVTQSPANFLWDTSRLVHILLLAPVSLLSAAPTTLAMVWLVRPDSADARATALARALLFVVLTSLLVYTVAGISNNRYAMPALAPASVAMAWCVRSARARFASERRARFVARGVPVMLWCLAALAGVNVWWSEGRRENISGRQAGEVIARSLRDGDVVWANQVVEYRPEVLWYAAHAAAREGRRVEMRWMPGAGTGTLPPSGALVLLLSPRDVGVSVGAYEQEADKGWELVARARVHKKDVELRRAR